MGDLINGPIGTVGSYDISLSKGVLTLSQNADIAEGTESVVVNVNAADVLTAIVAKLPGGLTGFFEKLILDAVINYLQNA